MRTVESRWLVASARLTASLATLLSCRFLFFHIGDASHQAESRHERGQQHSGDDDEHSAECCVQLTEVVDHQGEAGAALILSTTGILGWVRLLCAVVSRTAAGVCILDAGLLIRRQ